jgi:hypothetical protein
MKTLRSTRNDEEPNSDMTAPFGENISNAVGSNVQVCREIEIGLTLEVQSVARSRDTSHQIFRQSQDAGSGQL